MCEACSRRAGGNEVAISSQAAFPFAVLRAIIGGDSAIDIPRLTLRTEGRATEFLSAYGYEWDEPEHRRELETLRTESIAFIEQHLLEPGEQVPEFPRSEADIRSLLLTASGSARDPRQQWCCALLRVMHTLAHAGSPLEQRYGPEIRRQILARFEPHVRLAESGEAGIQLGTGAWAVPLASFEVKAAKQRASVAMKLLHKPENVATDVFDRIGVRFVTRDRFDALLVVRYLRVNNVFMFANVKPTRSRNTLVDLDRVETAARELDAQVAAGELSAAARDSILRAEVAEWPAPGMPDRGANPFSAVAYRSIQFTSRQLIRVPQPDVPGGELRFFFPFEVQILDEQSFAESRLGLAAHGVYKARQRELVRRRVLGPLVR